MPRCESSRIACVEGLYDWAANLYSAFLHRFTAYCQLHCRCMCERLLRVQISYFRRHTVLKILNSHFQMLAGMPWWDSNCGPCDPQSNDLSTRPQHLYNMNWMFIIIIYQSQDFTILQGVTDTPSLFLSQVSSSFTNLSAFFLHRIFLLNLWSSFPSYDIHFQIQH